MDSGEWAVLVSAVALLVTVVGWWATYGYQKKLLEKQGELQSEAQERQATIQGFLSEHDTRFDFLHKRRGEVLEELYKHLAWALTWLQSSTSSLRIAGQESPEKEQANALHEVRVLASRYNETRLLFDAALCKQMDELLSALSKVFLDLGLASHFASFLVGQDPSLWEHSFVIQRKQLLDEVGKKVNDDLVKMKEAIELQMRKILDPPEGAIGLG
jgi:hypothetical protein